MRRLRESDYGADVIDAALVRPRRPTSPRRRPVVLICRRSTPRLAPRQRNRRVATITAAAAVGRSTVLPRSSDLNYSHGKRRKTPQPPPNRAESSYMVFPFFRPASSSPSLLSPTSKFNRRTAPPTMCLCSRTTYRALPPPAPPSDRDRPPSATAGPGRPTGTPYTSAKP